MDEEGLVQQWFDATRPPPPSAALAARVMADAERQLPRMALSFRDVGALAASALVGLWLGWSGIAGDAGATAGERYSDNLDLVASLDAQFTP